MIRINESILDPMYGMKAKLTSPITYKDKNGTMVTRGPGTVVTILSTPKSYDDLYRVEFSDGTKYNLYEDEIEIPSDDSDETKFDKIINRFKSKMR